MDIRIENVSGEFWVMFSGNKIKFDRMDEAQDFAIKVLQAMGKLGY